MKFNTANFIGGAIAGLSGGTISGCVNNANIQNDSAIIGGITGITYLGLIENCYNTGTISNSGIVGIDNGYIIKNVYTIR